MSSTVSSRRQLLTQSAVSLAAVGVATVPAVAASRSTSVRDLMIDQDVAARLCANTMNRYEVYLAQAQLREALALFDLTRSDVQADVGFGFYYGPESIKRLFLGLHGFLEGDAANGTQKNGALYAATNTTEIVEVAEDLKTAKGAWLCNTISTPGDEKSGYKAKTGYCRRVADFVNVNGQWKLWHYFVYGMASAPVGKSWIDPDVYTANQVANVFPKEFAPDAPRARGIGTDGAWLPNRPVTAIKVPVPYRTFSETFTYALRS
jgi:hypothetical protein